MSTILIIVGILSVLGVVVGLVGTIVPILPGIPLIFLSVLFYASVTRFTVISGWTILVLGILALASYGMGLLTARGMLKRSGTTRSGMIGGSTGALFGVGIANLPGLIGGFLLGIVVGELVAGTPPIRILHAIKGALISLILSALFQFLIGVAMIVIAVVDVLR